MIRLAIICFLISMIESRNCEFGIDQLNEIKQIFHDSERRMERATRGQSENAAIVIGNGRGGKSTLINYIMGNELVANRSHIFEDIKISKANNNITGPEIGPGSLSTTTIPTKWNSERPALQNLDIWDSAGFADNRGIMQDLKNSFYLYHLTRKVKSLKLILVISFDEIINDNVEQMRKLLSTLEKYFTYRFRTFFPSISVIISKAPRKNNNYLVDYKYINTALYKNLLSNSNMSISEVSKDFVRQIIYNNQRLAFFRKAQKVGTLTSNIDVNIIPAIYNSKKIRKSSHQDMGLIISQELEICLRDANEILLPIDAILEFQTTLCDSFDEKFTSSCQSNDTNTLQTNIADLNRIYESLNTSLSNNSDAEVKIQALETVSDYLKSFTKNEELANKISLTKFIDFILEKDEMSYVINKVNALVETVKLKIETFISLCSSKLNDAKNKRRVQKSAWQKIMEALASSFLLGPRSTNIIITN